MSLCSTDIHIRFINTGYIEDLQEIASEKIYEHYKRIIEEAKIDLFISGDFKESEAEEFIKSKVKDLKPRAGNISSVSEVIKDSININYEKMELQQAKLVIGLKVISEPKNLKAIGNVYNTILGGSSNSKLFQNVREKESLAYSIGSSFIYPKKTIFIRGGIDLEKSDRAIEIIKAQLIDMQNGNFTTENLNDAKKYIVNSLTGIEDDQSPMIDYYMSCEMFEKTSKSISDYAKEINFVTKEEVIELANNIKLDTIYLLSSKEGEPNN